jgi:hypothetical protein
MQVVYFGDHLLGDILVGLASGLLACFLLLMCNAVADLVPGQAPSTSTTWSTVAVLEELLVHV